METYCVHVKDCMIMLSIDLKNDLICKSMQQISITVEEMSEQSGALVVWALTAWLPHKGGLLAMNIVRTLLRA
jgi:hypothetical protein